MSQKSIIIIIIKEKGCHKLFLWFYYTMVLDLGVATVFNVEVGRIFHVGVERVLNVLVGGY